MAVNLAHVSTFPQFAGQDARVLKRIFQTVTAESCPQTLNFHMHTVCSDGQLTPEQVAEQAIAIGLENFAITDHHCVDGYYRASQYLNAWQRRRASTHPYLTAPQLWVGVEINASLLKSEVHILCYAFNPEHGAMEPYLNGHPVTGEAFQAKQVIEAAHAAGGLAVLAHPDRYRQPARDLIQAAATIGVDGVETYYAYNNPSPWRPSPRQTAEIYDQVAHHGLFHTCGTDTHGISLLHRL